ncbi:hypothetical protein [Succinimonas sp.]|uniref:hypothetical protein n=1 Tax=Succinimonas sp. TaxID=1936151 RepID=UPI003864B721
MYIQVENNHGFTIKDAELSGNVERFFSEIKFDVSGIEKTLGKIGFGFDRNIDDNTIVVTVIADRHYSRSVVLTFAEVKERFVSFAASLNNGINSLNELFDLFIFHFR